MDTYTIDYEPLGRRGQCNSGESLLQCAQTTGLGINAICGGKGTCTSCKVRIVSGKVSPPAGGEIAQLADYELNDGWRLACQTMPLSNCTVYIPPQSMTTMQRTQTEGMDTAITLDPAVKAYRVKLQAPSIDDLTADATRVINGLSQQHGIHCLNTDIDVLRDISPRLRAWNWNCEVIVQSDEIIAVNIQGSEIYGMAFDIGTTKIAGYLIDLKSGRTIAAQGSMNPQISYGEDIISRIEFAMKSADNARIMQSVLIASLTTLTAEMCGALQIDVSLISNVVIAGNTAMHHLLTGLPVAQLALAPYIPVVCQALDIKARDLGLNVAKGAFIYLLPNIGGFVGADHVAMLLATKMLWQDAGSSLAIDIGTNTEVSLINKGKITAVSCASGPAFEGGHIKNGMRAASGAIERVKISGDSIQYQTIDEAPPIGICGSGILDIVAQLYLAGIIDESGKIQDGHPRVHTPKNQREFCIVNEGEKSALPIAITQGDIREVQLAKAAIRTGIQILLETGGCAEDELAKVIIAGAFGSYIDVASAITIGMLPSLPLDRFQQVGNAAGAGAKLALLSHSKRDEAQSIASGVAYLELAGAPHFMDTFMQANYIGRYRIKNGKREDIT